MLDFTPVQRGERAMNDLAADLTLDDLRRLVEGSAAGLEAMLDGLADGDVTFVPDDPGAIDEAAADPADRHLAWTLGHVIVHATASSEEYAALGAELARGAAVPDGARSRYETPWQTITTVAQCRRHLAENRRLRLANFGMWPDAPHLDNGFVAWDSSGWVNANGIVAWGLAHDDGHRRQAERIVAQARAARAERAGTR